MLKAIKRCRIYAYKRDSTRDWNEWQNQWGSRTEIIAKNLVRLQKYETAIYFQLTIYNFRRSAK